MLNENIKQGIKFYFVNDFKSVYELLFEGFAPLVPLPDRLDL